MGLFGGLTALTTLYLHDNGMASPPEDLFDGLTTLRTLYLNDNGMASLNVDLFDTLGDLSTLELSDNSITSLTAGVFEDLDDSMTKPVPAEQRPHRAALQHLHRPHRPDWPGPLVQRAHCA